MAQRYYEQAAARGVARPAPATAARGLAAPCHHRRGCLRAPAGRMRAGRRRPRRPHADRRPRRAPWPTDLDLLRDLCAAPAPTGFEAPVQDLVRRRLSALIDAARATRWATSGATVSRQGAPHVVVTAHADQIGLIVTYVDEHGFVSFDKIGGVDPQLLPGRNLVVHGAGGPVNGVVGRRPSHKMTQGGARQGAGPARPVARPRRLHAATRPSRSCRSATRSPSRRLPAAGRRPLRLAGLRQPRRRLRRACARSSTTPRRRRRPTSRRCSRCTRRPRSWAPRRWPSAGSPT